MKYLGFNGSSKEVAYSNCIHLKTTIHLETLDTVMTFQYGIQNVYYENKPPYAKHKDRKIPIIFHWKTRYIQIMQDR